MISLFSPAKANLFFRVLAKRPDGYHEVASLYAALSLFDTLSIEISDQDTFTSNEETLTHHPSNLVIRARDLFRKVTTICKSVSIRLEKKIPIGSGLGGGSSNAATTLWALNELFKKPLSLSELIHLGSEIGSDVPFFFSKGFAYCTGRGEKFEEITPFALPPFWIAKPDLYALATPKVYAVCKPNEQSTEDPRLILSLFETRAMLVNDLEPAAFRLIPELLCIKERLERMGFDKVVMTGSGTAFLCFGEVKEPKLSGVSFYFAQKVERGQGWY